MNCKSARSALEKFEEGEAINSAVIMAHINSCESCGREYRAVAQISESFDSLKAPEAGSNFNLKVWEKIGEVSPSPFVSFLSVIRKPFVFLPAAAMAVVLIVFVSTVQIKKAVLPQHNMETAMKQTTKYVQVARLAVKQAKKSTSNETVAVKPDGIIEQVKIGKIVRQEPVVASIKPVVHDSKAAESAPFSNDDRTTIQPAAFSSSGGSALVASANKQPDTGAGKLVSDKNKPGPDPGMVKSWPEIKTPVPAVKPVEIRNNVINALNNEKLIIKYRIDTAAEAVITIYDRNGKPVKQFEGSKQPGVYSFEWGGEGDNGVLLGAGIYIIHVKTDITDTKFKAAIIK
jgi:hypothetical protein